MTTMTTAPRPCLHAGCPELVPGGYCPRHATLGSLQAPAVARGYGHRWADVSRAYRRKHPTCERCHERPSALVHHKDGLGPLGPRGLEWNNLEAVCRRCHTAAHRELGRTQGASSPGGRARGRGTR
jgi:5-methylcytosine-specific restriction enzyme A